MQRTNNLNRDIMPSDLRNRTNEAPAQLEVAAGVWSRNIAARLRSIANYTGANLAEFIQRNISLADYNHILSRVNMLSGTAEGWSQADEPYAAQVLAGIRQELAEAREQQSTIIQLIQFAWVSQAG